MIASSTLRRGAAVARLPLTVGAAIAALALAGLAAWSLLVPADLPGTSLEGRPSPPFELTDYRGVAHRLSDFQGHPVVLAFLYTGCPDVCRLTTAGLAETAELLGEDAAAVRFVGVSVDPRGDQPSAVRRFLARQGLGDRMVYLTGPEERLEATWRDYHIYAQPEAHTDAVYLIDKWGRQRTLLRADFDPVELADALRALQREWL